MALSARRQTFSTTLAQPEDCSTRVWTTTKYRKRLMPQDEASLIKP